MQIGSAIPGGPAWKPVLPSTLIRLLPPLIIQTGPWLWTCSPTTLQRQMERPAGRGADPGVFSTICKYWAPIGADPQLSCYKASLSGAPGESQGVHQNSLAVCGGRSGGVLR